jgi:hypothetical protein
MRVFEKRQLFQYLHQIVQSSKVAQAEGVYIGAFARESLNML